MDMTSSELLTAARERFLFGLGKVQWKDPGVSDVQVPVETHYRLPESDIDQMKPFDPCDLMSREAAGHARTLTIVGGQYGMGKTTLVRRVARNLDGRRNEQEYAPRVVFPITLGWLQKRFREAMRSDDQNALAELLRSYFQRAKITGLDQQLDNLHDEIRKGMVVLALDGLDELISSRAEFEFFFRALAAYLTDRGGDPRYHIVVTMRTELLIAVGLNQFDQLRRSLDNTFDNLNTQFYFLQLKFFDRLQLEQYLGKRGFPEWKPVLKLPRIRAFLSRPLHLAVFCDMLDRVGRGNINPRSLLENQGPVELFSQFFDSLRVITFAPDDIQSKTVVDGAYKWNFNRLANIVMNIHRRRGTEVLDEGKLEQCIEAIDSQDESASAEDAIGDDGPMRRNIIHKCPFVFLSPDPSADGMLTERRYAFSHQIFYEYFVTCGIKDDLDKSADPADDEQFTPQVFDNLVLTVEMRRFLKEMIGETKWRSRTAYSYGLAPLQRQAWPKSTPFEVLDDIRLDLLQRMTNPESRDVEWDLAVDRFLPLVRQPVGWLHPRYLMYCLEACAVYLTHRYPDEERPAYRARKKEIETAVVHYLKAAHGAFRPVSAGRDPEGPALLDHLLLFERCLDIVLRLNISTDLESLQFGVGDLILFTSRPDSQDSKWVDESWAAIDRIRLLSKVIVHG